MKYINRGIAIFIFFCLILVFISINIIESKRFSTYVSKELTERFLLKKQIAFKWNTMQFGILPPSTRINGIDFQYQKEGDKIHCQLDKLQILFPWKTLISHDFQIDQVIIEGGLLTLDLAQTEKPITEDEIKKIIVQTISESLKQKNLVKKIVIRDLQLVTDGMEFLFRNITIQTKKKVALSAILDIKGKEQILPESLTFELSYQDSSSLALSVKVAKLSTEALLRSEIDLQSWKFKKNQVIAHIGMGTLAYLFPDLVPEGKGMIRIDGELRGDLFQPEYIGHVSSDDLLTPYFDASSINFDLILKKERISIRNFHLKERGGEINLQPIDASYQQLMTLSSLNLSANLKSVEFVSLFKILPELKDIKGRLTGRVDISLNKNHVLFKLNDGFVLKDARLVSGVDRIIYSNKMVFNNSVIDLNYKTLDVDLQLGALLGDSQLRVLGKINNDGVEFKTLHSEINLEDLGAIMEVPWEGTGRIDFSVISNSEKSEMIFNVELARFMIDKVKLGNIKGDLLLDFNRSNLSLNNISGYIGNSKYSGQGELDFMSDLRLRFDLMLASFTAQDFTQIFTDYLEKNQQKHLSQIGGTLQGRIKYNGVINNVKSYETYLRLNGPSLNYGFEQVNNWSIMGESKNGLYNIEKMTFNKKNGKFFFSGIYDISRNYVEFDLSVNEIRLTDVDIYSQLGLGLDGVINGQIYSSGTLDDFVGSGDFHLTRANLADLPFEDSHLVMSAKNKKIDIHSNLGSIMKVASTLALSQGQRSNLKAELELDNIAPLFGFFLSKNRVKNGFASKMDMDFKADFDLYNWKNSNLALNIADFYLMTPNMNLKSVDSRNKIVITNGKIKEWDILLAGKKARAYSKANGDLNNYFKLDTSLKLDSSIFEMFVPEIDSSSGTLDLDFNFVQLSPTERDFSLVTKLSKMKFKLSSLMTPIENLNGSLRLENNTLLVEKLSADLGGGQATMRGGLEFNLKAPSINLEYEFDNARMEIDKYSSVSFSGHGGLKGEKFPYQLEGDFLMLQGKTEKEFSEFTKSSVVKMKNVTPFLPRGVTLVDNDLVIFNIGIDMAKPYLFKNSLLDIYFNGKGRVGGGPNRPSFDGIIDVVPRQSRFSFKGQEFSIVDGSITFGKESMEDPLLSLTGQAKIRDYDVFVSVYGKVSALQMKLESFPVLRESEILSLLTLGITTEMSQGLTDQDKQSLASVGLGSLLMEQLSIGQGLTSGLGMKVSIIPDVENDPSSQLAGRVSGDSATTKSKSSTKIKVQKKVGEKVNLSLTSSVGGVSGQKQEMNINYNVNKVLSLEGVYEKKSQDATTVDTPDSFGADLKFRWSF